MSFFSAIKGVFKAAPPKTVDDIMDKDNGLLVKFGGFVNDLHYSDAEKATAMAEVVSGASEFVKSTITNSAFSIDDSTARSPRKGDRTMPGPDEAKRSSWCRQGRR